MSRAFVPHTYQVEIIDHIQAVDRGATWADMGSGKTVATLTALDHLSYVDDVWPALILAPKRVARKTWPDEVAKWDHLKHLGVAVALGDQGERKRALKQATEITTINYDNLPWLVAQYDGRKWPFRTVVADESTRLKGYRSRQGSKRAGALREVAHTDIARFVELTGTPSPKGLSDLWGQMWFLDRGHRLGRSYSAFTARWFQTGWDGYSLEPLPHAQREIEVLLQDICLTVRGLPVDEPLFNPIYVDLPPAAWNLYRSMEKNFYAEIERVGVEAFNAAVKTGKLQQFANGASYLDEKAQTWALIHDEKIEALKSVVEESGGTPILVAYTFRSDRERLLKAFPKAKHLGDDPKTIDDWNAGKIEMLVAHPKSAGHGLNLAEGGNILAFFGVDWNLEEHEQIIERIGPQRQKQAGLDRPVHVHLILGRNTIDEQIIERLQSRRSVQDVLREAMRKKARA